MPGGAEAIDKMYLEWLLRNLSSSHSTVSDKEEGEGRGRGSIYFIELWIQLPIQLLNYMQQQQCVCVCVGGGSWRYWLESVPNGLASLLRTPIFGGTPALFTGDLVCGFRNDKPPVAYDQDIRYNPVGGFKPRATKGYFNSKEE
jgi:hypothetical protein